MTRYRFGFVRVVLALVLFASLISPLAPLPTALGNDLPATPQPDETPTTPAEVVPFSIQLDLAQGESGDRIPFRLGGAIPGELVSLYLVETNQPEPAHLLGQYQASDAGDVAGDVEIPGEPITGDKIEARGANGVVSAPFTVITPTPTSPSEPTATAPSDPTATEPSSDVATSTSEPQSTEPAGGSSTPDAAPIASAAIETQFTDENGAPIERAEIGDIVTVSFTISNTGPVPLTGSSWSGGEVGAGELVAGTLEPGASETVSFAYTVIESDAAEGQVTFDFSLTAFELPAPIEATATLPVDGSIQLAAEDEATVRVFAVDSLLNPLADFCATIERFSDSITRTECTTTGEAIFLFVELDWYVVTVEATGFVQLYYFNRDIFTPGSDVSIEVVMRVDDDPEGIVIELSGPQYLPAPGEIFRVYAIINNQSSADLTNVEVSINGGDDSLNCYEDLLPIDDVYECYFEYSASLDSAGTAVIFEAEFSFDQLIDPITRRSRYPSAIPPAILRPAWAFRFSMAGAILSPTSPLPRWSRPEQRF